jgi:hypothetical protein
MKEQMKPSFERGRKTVAAVTLAALASIGVSSCSEDRPTTWSLAVTCDKDSEPSITPLGKESLGKYRSDGSRISFAVTCRDTDNRTTSVPTIEVVQGPSTIVDSYTEAAANVVITGIHRVGIEPDPRIGRIGDADIPGYNTYAKVDLYGVHSIENIEVIGTDE